MTFSATLPVKPSVTTTSALPSVERVALDVADEVQPLRGRQARVDVEHELRAARRLLADRQQRDARASTPCTTLASAAPMNANWTRCSARTSVFAPTSTSVTGIARDRDLRGERGAQDPAVALDVEQPGGERGAGRAGGDERVGVAGGHGPGGAHDRGLRVRAGGGGGVGLLGDRQRRVDDLDARAGVAHLGGGAEQQHAHALAGGEVGALGHLRGTEVGAVGVDGDDRDGARRVWLLAAP